MLEPKKYPIKTDLFRFITFRAPDKRESTDTDYKFIQHPSIANSDLGAILNTKDVENNLEKHLKDIDIVASYKDIRAVNPKLYDATSVFLKIEMDFPIKHLRMLKNCF